MGKMLEALRQIESRQPPARLPDPESLEPEVEPHSPLAATVVATPQQPAPPAEVESFFDTASPEEVQSSEEVEPREIEWSEMTVPPEEFVPTPEPPERSGEKAADPRYVALAETILSHLPADRKGALLLVGLDDHDVGGALGPLFPLLAERIPGRTIVVDCNDGCRAFARRDGGDADPGLAQSRSDEIGWLWAVSRSGHPRLDLLLGVDATTEDAPAPWLAPEALLGELRGAYQLVLLVGAPSSDPDVALLAGACDGAYLVVRLGQTSRRHAGRAIRILTRAGVGVLGCVLLER